ncbi:hypothetical protein PILCRDRAFT_818286 [Piloderma croceum F 1598]|uniref:HMG box domain-containing protein n=1 Tax=Piloderma croceum (strain F 1598) TaxID=765440 RepID=A0A0C3C4Z1_PILCF|nr:hypothetical protein PILCRDRAFT_818286 [Piloderma croceum F 1598]
MFPPMHDPFNFLQDNHYEYTDQSFSGCNLIEPFVASLIDPLPDMSYHHASSSSPTSTIPSLSPANSHSSLGSPSDNSTSYMDSMPTSPSSRTSSPACHSVSSSASPPPPSTSPSASPKSSRSAKEKRSLPADRIKRPANPFMCFRTYFCKNKPRELERHNATVSKITGIAWKKLSDEEKLPYIAQAAVIKAEFMAKHPEWRYRPDRKRPEPRKRRTRQCTLADERRYTRIALGFNSGKRGKELKRLAEMAETAGAEETSVPMSRSRRSRKSAATKKTSATTKSVVSTQISTPPAETNSRLVTGGAQISADFQPYTMPVHPVEEPSSLPGPSVCQELQPDDCFISSPIIRQPYEPTASTSILMDQAVFPQSHVGHVDLLMSESPVSIMDSTPMFWFDDWSYQQQFSSSMSNQLSFDDIMNGYA